MHTVIQKENFGEAAFTKSGLAVYDQLVLKLICPLAWGCSNEHIFSLYKNHLSGNHLEVGVGTGYFLDHADFPTAHPRIALLDLNSNCLERTARRIARYHPETHQANILKPISINARRFDSIGLNYVLHCLPGTFPEKGIAFAHLKALMNPGGVIFGATVLNGGVSATPVSRMLLRFFNARKTLSNDRDHYEGLRHALESHLKDVRIKVVGRAALFSGRA